MRIGNSETNFIKPMVCDVDEGFKKAKALGLDTFDVQCLINPELYEYDEKVLDEYFEKLSRASKEYGIELFQSHALWDMSIDQRVEENRKFIIQRYKEAAVMSSKMGIRNMVCHTLYVDGFGKDLNPEKGMDENILLFRELGEFAGDLGVNICIENLPFTQVESVSKVENVMKIVKAIGLQNVGMCLDTGHAHLFKKDISEDVDIIGEKLFALHIHDNNGDGDHHLIPYYGNIDWDAFLKALARSGFEGSLNYETNVRQAVSEKATEEFRKAFFVCCREMANMVEKYRAQEV